MGSYTASGDGDGPDEGNRGNIRLAHEHDMGVFAISAYDKGGRLYTPSHLSRELMMPEMEPMEYGKQSLMPYFTTLLCLLLKLLRLYKYLHLLINL